MTMKVQAFYNVTYNLGSERGQNKFLWGFGWFDLTNSENPLVNQILSLRKISSDEVFNLNLTAFTPIPSNCFEEID